MAKCIETVTTEIGNGPRGNYCDWCSLWDNDTLEFGDEQGNYQGGTTLSYKWYEPLIQKHEYPEDHVPSERYWNKLAKTLDYWKKKDMSFYLKIIEMCDRHKSTVLSKLPKIEVED